MLAEVIWSKGGFRFWHRRTKPGTLTYVYFLFPRMVIVFPLQWREDSATHYEWNGFHAKATLHSDRHSKIVHWLSHCDTVIMHHTWTVNFHQQCWNLYERETPSLLLQRYTRICKRHGRLGGSLRLLSKVYYQWQQANSNFWRRDPDPLVSAQRPRLQIIRVFYSGVPYSFPFAEFSASQLVFKSNWESRDRI